MKKTIRTYSVQFCKDSYHFTLLKKLSTIVVFENQISGVKETSCSATSQTPPAGIVLYLMSSKQTKWSGNSKGLATFEGREFGFAVDIEEDMQQMVFNWVREIWEYKLHWYFVRKSQQV